MWIWACIRGGPCWRMVRRLEKLHIVIRQESPKYATVITISPTLKPFPLLVADGEPAYDISISSTSIENRARLEFHRGHTERRTRNDAVAFYPAPNISKLAPKRIFVTCHMRARVPHGPRTSAARTAPVASPSATSQV